MSARQETIECYYNVYKSLHGVKPRYIDFSVMTDKQVDEAMSRLSIENNEYWAAQA